MPTSCVVCFQKYYNPLLSEGLSQRSITCVQPPHEGDQHRRKGEASHRLGNIITQNIDEPFKVKSDQICFGRSPKKSSTVATVQSTDCRRPVAAPSTACKAPCPHPRCAPCPPRHPGWPTAGGARRTRWHGRMRATPRCPETG